MAGFTSSFNRFSALNRPNFNGSFSGGGTIAGGNFIGQTPQGFGGVGSFNNQFRGVNSGIGGFNSGIGGFNNFANPYAFGGGFGGGGAAGAWGQFAFLAVALMPQILQGVQALFQGIGERVQERRSNSEHCNQGCSGGGHHDNNSGHPDMSVHEGSYIDGQEGHRIDEAGVNMSFEMDY